MKRIMYVDEPDDAVKFTREFDRFYSMFAGFYSFFIRVFPIWKRWIGSVLPYVKGPNVLEISFGTAHLLPMYASKYNTFAMDFNSDFVKQAKKKLRYTGISSAIQQANVEHLPYAGESFDCIINTMAFTGYPDGYKALNEMFRVLKPDGLLLMVDIEYPSDENRAGVLLIKLWMLMGDLVRDMHSLFTRCNFSVKDTEIGGFGSVHLYIAEKNKSI